MSYLQFYCIDCLYLNIYIRNFFFGARCCNLQQFAQTVQLRQSYMVVSDLRKPHLLQWIYSTGQQIAAKCPNIKPILVFCTLQKLNYRNCTNCTNHINHTNRTNHINHTNHTNRINYINYINYIMIT